MITAQTNANFRPTSILQKVAPMLGELSNNNGFFEVRFCCVSKKGTIKNYRFTLPFLTFGVFDNIPFAESRFNPRK
jgi:hypothetical protein